MPPTTNGANGAVNKLTFWLMGILFTVAFSAIGAYVGLANADHERTQTRVEKRLDALSSLSPRVSALEAKVDTALKSIDTRLGSIERKLDVLAGQRLSPRRSR